MSYGSMPPPPPPYGGYGGYGPPQPATPPESVVNAVRLMWLTSALSLISLVLVFTLRDEVRTQIRNAHNEAGNLDISQAELNRLVNTAIAIAVVFALIFVVLYVLLSFQVRKGKQWARIITWILSGLAVISALSGFAENTATTNKVLGLVSGVIALAIIVLLARAESNQYFKRPTYPSPPNYPPSAYPPSAYPPPTPPTTYPPPD